MLFDRMMAARDEGVSEHGKPERYTLNTADYLTFIGTPHELRTANHAATIWQFDTLSVTESGDSSALHYFDAIEGKSATIEF